MGANIRRDGTYYIIRLDGRDIIRTKDKDEALWLAHVANVGGKPWLAKMQKK